MNTTEIKRYEMCYRTGEDGHDYAYMGEVGTRGASEPLSFSEFMLADEAKAALDAKDGEIAALKGRLDDYEDDRRRVLAGTCSGDEKHCACVPDLRARVASLEVAIRVLGPFAKAEALRWAEADDGIKYGTVLAALDALQPTSNAGELPHATDARHVAGEEE